MNAPIKVSPAEISFIFQGPVDPYGGEYLSQSVAQIRSNFPAAEIVLSTWALSRVPPDLAVDRVVYSEDPGGLPGIRVDGKSQNNVNRQLVSTRRGLEAASRPFSAKVRTDCRIDGDRFLRLYERHSGAAKGARILTCNLFTIDPRMFEQVPYHVSDWFHFGPTPTLLEYWSAPSMSVEDATYYSRHRYARHSTYLDRNFRCRLAVEQHYAVHYAKQLGYLVPEFHNDNRSAILKDFDRFLADRVLIAEMNQIGLQFPKYEVSRASGFQDLNCISHLDWMRLADVLPSELSAADVQRRRRKRTARAIYAVTQPFAGILYTRKTSGAVKHALKILSGSAALR